MKNELKLLWMSHHGYIAFCLRRKKKMVVQKGWKLEEGGLNTPSFTNFLLYPIFIFCFHRLFFILADPRNISMFYTFGTCMCRDAESFIIALLLLVCVQFQRVEATRGLLFRELLFLLVDSIWKCVCIIVFLAIFLSYLEAITQADAWFRTYFIPYLYIEDYSFQLLLAWNWARSIWAYNYHISCSHWSLISTFH